MADLNSFKDFYATFMTSMRAGDEAALRAILPPTVEDDHAAFLMQLNQALAQETVEPQFACDGTCATATYQVESEDGTETMTRNFWWHEGRWVSYDPNEAL